MKPFESKDYKAFTMFEKRWALVTAVLLVGAAWATCGA